MEQAMHPTHMTPEQRSLHGLRESMDAMMGILSGAQSVTIKGADGKTPVRGEDYLTPDEIETLKLQIGQLVVDYVIPRIRQPLDGKTPIPGVDFPTVDQVMAFAEAAIEKIRKEKVNRKQLAEDAVEILKNKGGVVKWGNIKDVPDVKEIVEKVVGEQHEEMRKAVIKKEAVDWRYIKNKPDFESLLQGIAELSGGVGSILRIQEEGQTVSEHVTTLNFIGSSATATYMGNGVIAITLSSTGSNFAENETPTGTQDGVNAVFTLAQTPSGSSLQLYMNGQLLAAGGEDYTLAGATITYVSAKIPLSTDIIRAWYRY